MKREFPTLKEFVEIHGVSGDYPDDPFVENPGRKKLPLESVDRFLARGAYAAGRGDHLLSLFGGQYPAIAEELRSLAEAEKENE